MLELFGYLASLVTVISLMMGNIVRLRMLNLAGALALAAYSAAIHAWPLVAVNAIIAVVDLYHLWRLTLRRETFTLVRVLPDDAAFLQPFLKLYREDIARFFPEFDLAEISGPRCVFILRDLAPVGLFIYADEGNKTARIHLDYVIPAYRDLKAARFFYNRSWQLFLDEGFRELVVRNPVPAHERYCRKVGFGPSLTNPRALVRTLAVGADLPAQESNAS